VFGELDAEQLAARLPHFTGRAVTTLTLAVDRARESGAPNVTTGHLLHGIVAEGGNLALQILASMEIDPARLTAGAGPEPGGTTTGPGRTTAGPSGTTAGPSGTTTGPGGDGLRFSTAAGNALELAVGEATAMGHNYVGCEHLLIGLAAEPDGGAGKALREAGAQPRAVRQAVAAALAGYAHLRAKLPAPPPGAAGILTAVKAELQPLIERIERLERRVN
jgi:ATP-dependent Clp protease ATP-binding subunit ClpC